ncbi:MAG: L-fuculose kinase, partial [Pseudomonadota bacterium]
MRNAFADASAHTAIARVIVTTHGAAAACVVADGSLSAPVMDYEAEIPGPVSVAYEAERPTFAETGSPSLPAGLNLGRQLAWQAALGQLDRARHILTLPQYWAWKLCGVAAGELSALGCHTDLWRQDGEGPSSLAQDRGWARLLPPLAGAGDVLGTVSAEVQASTGLAADCQVHCGVHDSNAALYAMARATQRLRLADPLFISTGTWSIVMAPGRPATALDQTKDTLTNIAVDGRTVPTARFMSGPEYAVLAGTEKGSPPEIDGIQQAIDRRALVTPNLTGDIAGGPFAGRIGRIEPASADDRLRQALAALYIPLMWDKMLTLVAPGERRAPIVVEGPAATPEMTGVLAGGEGLGHRGLQP